MNTFSIPANATAKAILETNKPPRGATHFRYTEGRRKPIIDAIKNIDCLAGCTGKLEFGKVSFDVAKLVENAQAIVTAVKNEKPAGAKGEFIRNGSVSTTMGVGIRVNVKD